MPYEILFGKSARKTYERLGSKLKQGLDRCIAYLEMSPEKGPNIQKLINHPGCWRYRVGGWRILYEVDEERKEVRIYEIRSRGDVYKH